MKIEFINTQGLLIIIPTIVIETNPRVGEFEIVVAWLFRQLSFTFGDK
jgi:hypothetical protein